MDRKIILFELNEVPLRIVREYVRWRPESTLAKRLPDCRVYETVSEDTVRLSPWVTWPSLYRGVNDEQHTIDQFGQDLSEIDGEFPPIWQVLVENEVDTGVFGTLHSYPPPENIEEYAFYVPDAFAAGSECFPEKVENFQDFNLAMSRDSPRNVSTSIHWDKALRFLVSAPDLGLKISTCADVAGQLVKEKIHPWKRVRRRTYQSVLAFDIFMQQLETKRPDFCTFFTNHVASSMHRYWAAAFPDDYDEYEFEGQWRQRFENEIEFTMHKFDAMFRRLIAFVEHNPDYQLLVTTSMGQQATEARPLETQLYIVDLEQFMRRMGAEPHAWEKRPAMAPRVSVFVDEEYVDKVDANLSALRIDGEPIEYHQRERGFFNIRLGQENLHETDCIAELRDHELPFEEMGLETVEIEDRSNTTAYHVPEGSLMIFDPKQTVRRPEHTTQVSTLDLAPYLLQNFSVDTPDYMKDSATL